MNTNRTIAAAPGKPGMSADRKAAVWIEVWLVGYLPVKGVRSPGVPDRTPVAFRGPVAVTP